MRTVHSWSASALPDLTELTVKAMVNTLVIGSGVAAAALTQRLLAQDPSASILILEAGTRVKMQDAAIWQDYIVSKKLPYTKYYDRRFPERDAPGENVNAGKTAVTLEGARVFTYGGSTIHWGGWSFRLRPEDFALKSSVGKSVDWPFGYSNLEPYYLQAEHYLGVSGDSSDNTVPRNGNYPYLAFPYTLEDRPMAAALDALGIAHSHLPIARRGFNESASRHAPCQTTGTCKYCPFGARYSANNYLDEILSWGQHSNLQIRLNSAVQQICMGSKTTASGVTYVDKTDGQVKHVEAQRIVVAAGAIESAKLLKRSKNEFWVNGVGNDTDLVGRHLVTHPYFMFTAKQNGNNNRLLQPEMNFPTLCSRHFDSEKEQASGKFLLVNPPGSPQIDLAKLMQQGFTRREVEAAILAPTVFEMHGMVEVFGEPTNYVDNHNIPNFMGLNQTVVNYTEDSGFSARMAQIQETVKEIFRAMDASLLGKPSISWRADHAACTVRMSVNEKEGVTDANLRVHSVQNLYVCSNGVFPNIGAVNPTLTLTALALRLGDHLNAVDRASGGGA